MAGAGPIAYQGAISNGAKGIVSADTPGIPDLRKYGAFFTPQPPPQAGRADAWKPDGSDFAPQAAASRYRSI